MGSENTLFAYDVEQNYDIFYKDVSDGVSVVCEGKMMVKKEEHALAFVGGNCSIYGYDHEGEEVYWNVTGGDVTAMHVAQGEGQSLLVVSADDFTTTVFRGEEMLFQLNLS